MKADLLKASAWFIAGILVAVFLAGRTFDIIQLMQAGATTSARVTETFDDEREEGRRVGIVTVAVYEFFVRNTRFIGKTEGVRGGFSVGDTLPIQYDSRNPSINRAKGDRHELGNYVIMLICGGFFSYYTITTNFPTVRRFLRSRTNTRHEPV